MKRLRVVPDTQVILSGLTSDVGPSFELLRAARQFRITLVMCEQHFTEMERVLTYANVLRLGGGRITPSYAFWMANELHRICEFHDRVGRLDWPSCPDPKDWYLLDLLVSADAEGIISKDKHLLQMKKLVGLPVDSPAELKAKGLI